MGPHSDSFVEVVEFADVVLEEVLEVLEVLGGMWVAVTKHGGAAGLTKGIKSEDQAKRLSSPRADCPQEAAA